MIQIELEEHEKHACHDSIKDIVPKNASWRGVPEAAVTKITSMNRQVMNISVVMRILVIRNVKRMAFMKILSQKMHHGGVFQELQLQGSLP